MDGVLAKDSLTSSQLVLVNCESRGGSPSPTLALTLDGSPLLDSSSSDGGPISHAIAASPELNTKVLACTAINRVMDEHTVTETVLRIRCESCRGRLNVKRTFFQKISKAPFWFFLFFYLF